MTFSDPEAVRKTKVVGGSCWKPFFFGCNINILEVGTRIVLNFWF